jgi:hypothetical protein
VWIHWIERLAQAEACGPHRANWPVYQSTKHKAQSACACAKNREAWKSGTRDSPCFLSRGICGPLPAAPWCKMCPCYTKTWLAVTVPTVIITIWKTNKIAPEVLRFEISRMATYPGKYRTYYRAIEIDLGRCANSSGTPWQSRKVGKVN